MKLAALAEGQIVQAQRYWPQFGGMFNVRIRHNAASYDLQFHVGAEERHILYYSAQYPDLATLQERLQNGHFYTSKVCIFSDLAESNQWRSHAQWRKYKRTPYENAAECRF